MPGRELRSSHLSGTGQSYWGPILGPSDSTVALFARRPSPLWERSLGLPYQTIKLPLRLVGNGAKVSFRYLHDQRVFSRIAYLVGPRKGPFGVAVRMQAGGLSGFGGGLTLSHDAFLAPQNRLKVRWHSTLRGTHKLSGGVQLNRGASTQLIIGAGYRLRPNARYFGIGPKARESDETFYTQEVTWAGLSLRRQVSATVLIEGTALLSTVGTSAPGDDDDRSIEELATLERPSGYGQRSDAVGAALTLLRDTTTEMARPLRGGIQRIKLSRTWNSRTDRSPGEAIGSDFWTLRGEVQQFVPLWFSKQALAVRLFASWIEPDEPKHVPFQRLLTNDDPDLLRGYDDFRWRDRGITVLTAEYRWPFWANRTADDAGADIYLFSDAGQVFGEFTDISRDTMTLSYGCGLRIVGLSGFIGRCEVAWSEEDLVFRVRSDQVFQFAKGGLLHGRDQVALR
jgi:hypothetical protein